MFKGKRIYCCADHPNRGRRYPSTRSTHFRTRVSNAFALSYGDADHPGGPNQTNPNCGRHSGSRTITTHRISHSNNGHRTDCKPSIGWEKRDRTSHSRSNSSGNPNIDHSPHTYYCNGVNTYAYPIPHRSADSDYSANPNRYGRTNSNGYP